MDKFKLIASFFGILGIVSGIVGIIYILLEILRNEIKKDFLEVINKTNNIQKPNS